MTQYEPSATFHEAAKYLSSSPSLSNISNDKKLELYGLFKLLTVSPEPSTPRPSIFDFAGRAKWDSWKRLGEKWKGNETGAEDEYINFARSLGWTPGESHQTIAVEKTVEELLAEDSPRSSESSSRGGDAGLGMYVSTLRDKDEATRDVSTIHDAAICHNTQILVDFIDTNGTSDINSLDQYGFTPLHLACDRGITKNVKVLLDNGADTTMKDPDGFTALELAQEVGHEEIVLLFGSHVGTAS